MKAALLVGAGGFLGSIARYLVSRAFTTPAFPLPTLIVNVAGCFVIGLFSQQPREEVRLFVSVGILGGFTTFSAFGLETVSLKPALAAANIAANVVLGLAAVMAGRAVVA